MTDGVLGGTLKAGLSDGSLGTGAIGAGS